MEVLRFQLAGATYALPVEHVREIVRAVAVTPLPGAPPVVVGLINLRGLLVPVMDLRARLRLPPRPVALEEQWVVARAGERTVALRADQAVDLVTLDDEAVREARSVVPTAELAAGVAPLPDGLLVIFDAERFLSQAEAESLDEALRALEGAA